ncbi:MAG TPA: caspase family protein, partial [Stellaceae bacterium]|nr:caspase family protein [Stellaceae bacterium]
MPGRRRIGRERGGGFAIWRIGLWPLAFLLILTCGGRTAAAATERLALVVGEAAYSTLPGEPACLVSAQTIAARLRALGFDVIAQTNASNGEMGAMLIDLAHRAASAAHPTVAIYFCGHVVEFDGRVFLLPVGAVLERPSDALAEGLPAQSFLDIAARGTRVGLSLLDAYAGPHTPSAAPAALASFLAGQALSPGHVAMTASETAAVTTATPLAQSLSAALAKPPVDLDAMVAAVRKDLTESGGGVAFAVAGSGGGATLVAAATAAAPAPPPA